MVNHAQLVGTQDGHVLVPTYDWSEFFDAPFRQSALSGIKAMHHLTFTHLKPGTVIVKDSVTSPEREINLLQNKSWKPRKSDLPPVISPPGLASFVPMTAEILSAQSRNILHLHGLRESLAMNSISVLFIVVCIHHLHFVHKSTKVLRATKGHDPPLLSL